MSLSRRTVVQGAAWSVPVIALAPAAQAFQVSPGDIWIPDQPVVAAIKCPGKSTQHEMSYIFSFYIHTKAPDADTATLSISVAGTAALIDVVQVEGAEKVIAGGASSTSLEFTLPAATAPGADTTYLVKVLAGETGSSADLNATITATITYKDRHGTVQSSTGQITVQGTPPDGDACSAFAYGS